MMVVMKKRERVLICHNGTLLETDMPINAGDQTTKKNTKLRVQQRSTKSSQYSQYSYKHTSCHFILPVQCDDFRCGVIGCTLIVNKVQHYVSLTVVCCV